MAADGIKIVAENRKARAYFEILEKFEAGIVLTGAEIKSVRAGGISINEAYVKPESNSVLLLGAHVRPYAFSNDPEYVPTRPRKLLLSKMEINKLRGRVEQQGLTIVPLKCYLRRGFAKLEIALARGKNAPDRRQDIKRREADREIARATKRR